MLYKFILAKAICLALIILSFQNTYCMTAEERLTQKYEKWKEAVDNPNDASAVFRFFFNNPHWPLFDETVKIAERNATMGVPDTLLLKWFNRYHPKTSEGIRAYTNCLLKTDPALAEEYIRQTWIFQNLSPQFMREYKGEFGNHMSSMDDAKKAKRLMNSIKIDQLDALKGIVDGEISEHISAFLKKHFSSKAVGYSKNDLKDADRKYEIVQRLIDKKQDKAAADILSLSNDGEERYATSFFNQRRHVAFNMLRSGNPKLAYGVMKLYKLGSKKSEKIAKAEWLLGYIAFRFFGDNKKAAAHFAKAYENSESAIRLSKNAFWLAEVYRKRGDVVLAMNWYEKAERFFSTFYGYLARQRLRKLGQHKNFANESHDAAFTFFNRELVQVLLKVKDSNMRKYFYQQLINEIEDPNEEMLLMDIAVANNETSILIAENSRRQRYFSNDKAYKVLSRPDMQTLKRIKNDACFTSLVHAIIHRESNFNERAKSYAGAIGIMQIMPVTAAFEAKRLKFHVGKEQLFDRQKNITIGASILNRLLKKYVGNIVYAIAAYNCGEGNVSKYRKNIKKLKKLTPLDIIELIPIKETRIYVKHVIRSMFTYQKKFATNACYNCNEIIDATSK